MWKILLLVLVCMAGCRDDADPAHHENNCGGACPPDACGGVVVDAPPICNLDGVCNGSETTQNCAADCPPPPACNNDGVCDATEQYATCMMDCAAKVRVQNNSSYTIFYVYLKKCVDTTWSANQLAGGVISPGQSFTLAGVPPGCWNFKATDSGMVHTWQTPNGVNLLAGVTYPWTLVN